ncbi:hypothetical protein ACHAWO_005119 [Cyclotella atomus]|uniref:Uncharacterized protein n=1 Tax=Cyclotella atomus TaxID=382360 RepID=A0ABD3PG85_9STRA
MLGCIGLKCNVVEAIDNGEQPTAAAAPGGQQFEVEDNDLVLKPLAVEIPSNERQQPGRCPFKQCVETFSPRQLMKDDDPVTTSVPVLETKGPVEATTVVNKPADTTSNTTVEPTRQKETPAITGITTIDAIRSKNTAVNKPPPKPPTITGIATIDAIAHTLSGDNTKYNNNNHNHNESPHRPGLAYLERKQEILKQLGILHLEDKLTRPRQSQETDEHILREAGAALHLENDEGSISEQSEEEGGAKATARHIEQRKLKSMSRREIQILKEAGVTSLPIDSHVVDSTTTAPALRECFTETTIGLTTIGGVTTVQPSESFLTSPTTLGLESQGPNHTYAEKELIRRLKNGWVSSGSDCIECGMPIIYKMDKGGEKGLLECVICGILDNNEEEGQEEMVQASFSNFDTTISSGMTIANQNQNGGQNKGTTTVLETSLSNFGSAISSYAPFIGTLNSPSGMEIYHGQTSANQVPQRQVASPTGMSIHEHHPRVASPIHNPHNRVTSPSGMPMSIPIDPQTTTLEQCPTCQDEVTSQDSTIFGQNHQSKDVVEKCKSDLLHDDDALKKELGRRIFAGWTLLSLNCPNCNLPLICEGKGSPSICLRCD